MGERVLQNADQAAGKQAGQRTAPRRREPDGDQQRKIKNGEEWKSQRQPCLQKNGSERNQNGCRNAETVDLNLFSRSVSDGHVSGDDPQPPLAVWVWPLTSRAWGRPLPPRLRSFQFPETMPTRRWRRPAAALSLVSPVSRRSRWRLFCQHLVRQADASRRLAMRQRARLLCRQLRAWKEHRADARPGYRRHAKHQSG